MLFSGLTAISDWAAAFEDWIFRIEEEPASGELQLVRYRLVEPF